MSEFNVFPFCTAKYNDGSIYNDRWLVAQRVLELNLNPDVNSSARENLNRLLGQAKVAEVLDLSPV